MIFSSKFLRHLYKEDFFINYDISKNIEKVVIDKTLDKNKIRKIIIDLFFWLKKIENTCMYAYVDENSIYYDIENDLYFLYNYEDLSFKKNENSYGYSVNDTISNRVTEKSFLKSNHIFPCWGIKIMYDISVLFLEYGYYICIDFYSDKVFYFDDMPKWTKEELDKNLLVSSIDLNKKNWQTDYIKNGVKLIKDIDVINMSERNNNNSNIITNEELKNNLDMLIHKNSLEYNKKILYQVYELFNEGNLIFEHKDNLNDSKDCTNKKYFVCTQSLTIDINQPIFKGYILNSTENNDLMCDDCVKFDIDDKEFLVLKFNSYDNNYNTIKDICNYHYNKDYVIKINECYYNNLVMSELIPVKSIKTDIDISKFINDLIPIIKKLHKNGYSHYDIKPDNIMKKYNRITGSYDYVLIDYDSIFKNKLDFPRQSFTPLFSMWNNNYKELFECAPFTDHIIHDLIELIHTLHFLIFDTIWSFGIKSDIRILNTFEYLCNIKWDNIGLDDKIYDDIIKIFNK